MEVISIWSIVVERFYCINNLLFGAISLTYKLYYTSFSLILEQISPARLGVTASVLYRN